jgi:hypothetical protein
MLTLCCLMLRTSSQRIRNYANSDGQTGKGGNFQLPTAIPRHIRITQVITQPKKLQSQLVGFVTAVMYQVASFTYIFLRHGSPTAWRHPQNLAGDAHHLLLHV